MESSEGALRQLSGTNYGEGTEVEASCSFFAAKPGFEVRFQYGKPPFYALVQTDSASLNLRHLHKPVLNRDLERDLLSASIRVCMPSIRVRMFLCTSA